MTAAEITAAVARISAAYEPIHKAKAEAFEQLERVREDANRMVFAAQGAVERAIKTDEKARVLYAAAKHIESGKCSQRVKDATRWNNLRCDKAAKIACSSCGGPVCGVHGRKNTYGVTHQCADWRSLEKQLFAEAATAAVKA
jgi:hypothetical protein